ncbi:L-lactate permease [Demequina gelatinilytica]|uniref:L-lactate permease n=1 Tax=Demequina gelatinilytica TaxID=1638980 RepID=UPI000784C52D|nr:L-lactate permease [Demequina gelatinilytica]
METLLAALPIVVVLVLMIGLKWSAIWAGAAAAVVALAIALTTFAFGTDAGFGRVEGVTGVVVSAAWTALTVMLIIGPALGIHHLQQRTGATAAIEAGLARITPDPRVAALLIAWFFTLLIEGAAGFGTPVALSAPFLVAAGFKPVTAVVAAMAGNVAAVPFGAVGTPTLAQAQIVDYEPVDLSWAVSPYMVVTGAVLAIVVARLVGTLIPTAGPPWRWMAVAYVAFFAPYLLIARFVGPELPSLMGAIVGAGVFIAVVRAVVMRRARAHALLSPAEEAAEREVEHAADSAEATEAHRMGLLAATAPYAILVALVLLTRLVPPIKAGSQSWDVTWSLFGGAFGDGIQPLYHPGPLLLVAFLGGALWQRASRSEVGGAFSVATRQVVPVFAALTAMVTVAYTMSDSGMTTQLAVAAAGTGAVWPLLSPFVGALGTFMTGSATSSNILFTDFQDLTATEAGLSPLPLLGAQGAGAAIGNAICPHNIIAAAATVGLAGREGELLKGTLPPAMITLVVTGGMALLLA